MSVSKASISRDRFSAICPARFSFQSVFEAFICVVCVNCVRTFCAGAASRSLALRALAHGPPSAAKQNFLSYPARLEVVPSRFLLQNTKMLSRVFVQKHKTHLPVSSGGGCELKSFD